LIEGVEPEKENVAKSNEGLVGASGEYSSEKTDGDIGESQYSLVHSPWNGEDAWYSENELTMGVSGSELDERDLRVGREDEAGKAGFECSMSSMGADEDRR